MYPDVIISRRGEEEESYNRLLKERKELLTMNAWEVRRYICTMYRGSNTKQLLRMKEREQSASIISVCS